MCRQAAGSGADWRSWVATTPASAAVATVPATLVSDPTADAAAAANSVVGNSAAEHSPTAGGLVALAWAVQLEMCSPASGA